MVVPYQPHAYCKACGVDQIFDERWRLMVVGEKGECLISAPTPWVVGCLPRESALVCGLGAAMILVERYLDRGTFEPADTAPIHAPEKNRDHVLQGGL